MAKATMEVSFLGTQMTQVEGTKYAKVFFGEEPDGETSQGQSIVGMAIHPDVATEVFMSGSQFELQQLVRIHFEVARGGQNKGKTIAHHIEAVDTKGRSAASPAPAANPGKPADPAKS